MNYDLNYDQIEKNRSEGLKRESARTALGGIVAALSVALMLLSSVIPFLQYVLPAIAGAILAIIVIELNKRWAVGTYIAVSILSFIMIPDKETAMMYISFFGYYSVVKIALEQKIKLRPVRFIIKFLIFNIAMVCSYALLIYVFGMPIEDLTDNGWKGLLALLALANVMMVCYDFALTQMIRLYVARWQKRFRKIFK